MVTHSLMMVPSPISAVVSSLSNFKSWGIAEITAPGKILQFFPILAPLKIVTFEPIHVPSPISTLSYMVVHGSIFTSSAIYALGWIFVIGYFSNQ